MPAQAPAASTEKESLIGFLAQQQDAFLAAGLGLTDEQAGRRSTPSALTVGSLVKHAAGVQQAWTDRIAAAPDPPQPDPRPAQERMAEYDAQHQWLESDSLAAATEALRRQSAATLQAVRDADLDTRVPVPDAPWFPKDLSHWSVRWVVLHLIEELARHAGHADLLREGIDGATMYELLAALEGWPETDWLKPWAPARS